MWSKKSQKFKEIENEIELEDYNEKKAEKAYNALRNGALKSELSNADKKRLFNCIKNTTKTGTSEQTVASWCFLGDCYYYGLGCKQSFDDAEDLYMEVLRMESDDASNWRNWAASRITNIYIKQNRIDGAKRYIGMSTLAEDYKTLAEVLWKIGDEKSALELYKKAGDYGLIECYAQAVNKCASSSDTRINDKVVEYACMYFESDADMKSKQKIADSIMKDFYNALQKAEQSEKKQLRDKMDRFKQILDDKGLKRETKQIARKKRWNKTCEIGRGVYSVASVVGGIFVITAKIATHRREN